MPLQRAVMCSLIRMGSQLLLYQISFISGVGPCTSIPEHMGMRMERPLLAIFLHMVAAEAVLRLLMALTKALGGHELKCAMYFSISS